MRLDPDELLANLEKEGLGKLTIFLGAAAGVGKTYAMLEVAGEKLSEGMDVVVGLVEAHERAETKAMLKGLPVIPTKPQDYKGKTFSEMDLDGILARRPQIALVNYYKRNMSISDLSKNMAFQASANQRDF